MCVDVERHRVGMAIAYARSAGTNSANASTVLRPRYCIEFSQCTRASTCHARRER